MLLWVLNLDFAASGADTPPAPSPAGPSNYGGGGGIAYRERAYRRPHRELKSLLDESLSEVYAELTEAPAPVAAKAREIAKPFKHASSIDWGALEANASAVGRLLALVAKQRTADRVDAQREALARSDEDWFLMS